MKLFSFLLLLSLLSFQPLYAYIAPIKGKKVVYYKKYPKDHKLEIGFVGLSSVLNEPYTQTYYVGGSLGFHFSDEIGVEVVGGAALLSDKGEREALENWVNSKSLRYDPKYPELIENQFAVSFNLVYTPFYAKQLFLYKAITYYDIFLTLGLGVNGVKYYPSFDWRHEVYGDPDRPIPPKKDDGNIDLTKVGYTEGNKSGIAGRDYFYNSITTTKPQIAPSLNLGFGQRYFLFKYFNLRFEVKDHILFVSNIQGEYKIMNMFLFWLGVGVMF